MPLFALCRLSPELSGLIADHMDLASLISWRQTCIASYAHSTASLERTLLRLVNIFLTHPPALLRLVADFNAVIGGEVALAYVRREKAYRPRTLEIFAGRLQYDPLCRAILSSPRLSPDITHSTVSMADYPVCTRHDIVETLEVHLRCGLSLYVRQSTTFSPVSPIARAICTAFMNFVTPHSFGCAYPRLTLHNRALLCDVGMRTVDVLDDAARTALIDLGIETAVHPSHWSEYRVWSPTPEDIASGNACWRSHFICPQQGRFFGDRGSFVDFISPLECGAKELRDIRAPPFGATIVWRLSSSYRCIMDCDGRDALLPCGVTSHPIVFVYDRLRSIKASAIHMRGVRSSRGRVERSSSIHVVRRSHSLPPHS